MRLRPPFLEIAQRPAVPFCTTTGSSTFTANSLMHGAENWSASHKELDRRRQKWNADLVMADDNYLVRVTGLAGATSSFIWEVCRGDGLLVLQRSTKTFPTRVEALLDSARSTATLALDIANHLPLPFV